MPAFRGGVRRLSSAASRGSFAPEIGSLNGVSASPPRGRIPPREATPRPLADVVSGRARNTIDDGGASEPGGGEEWGVTRRRFGDAGDERRGRAGRRQRQQASARPRPTPRATGPPPLDATLPWFSPRRRRACARRAPRDVRYPPRDRTPRTLLGRTRAGKPLRVWINGRRDPDQRGGRGRRARGALFLDSAAKRSLEPTPSFARVSPSSRDIPSPSHRLDRTRRRDRASGESPRASRLPCRASPRGSPRRRDPNPRRSPRNEPRTANPSRWRPRENRRDRSLSRASRLENR